jgi:hypothetical protein
LFSSSASSSSSTRVAELLGMSAVWFELFEAVLRSFSYVKQNWDFFTFYKQ